MVRGKKLDSFPLLKVLFGCHNKSKKFNLNLHFIFRAEIELFRFFMIAK